MKNRSKIAMLLTGLLFVGSLFVTSSCKDDPYNTDQMSSDKTTIQVYGPRPALRGGEIRFVGTNMDRVTAVVFPVAGEVTEFTMKEKNEIRVIVPINAGYGSVVLKTPQGDVTTDNDISYTEQMEVTHVTETPVKAGSKIEIEGYFLYLINRVIFQGGAFVNLTDADKTFDAEKPIDKQKLSVTVPETALSGELILSIIYYDTAGAETGIPVELGSGEWVVNIVEPVITGFSPATVKAGATLTITGTDLDLVKEIRFGGEKVVDTFTLNGQTSISVTVPADAQDGKVVIVAKSGAESKSADDLIMLLPTVTSLSPNPFKFDVVRDEEGVISNGAKLTIEGTDFDLVTDITFIGSGAVAIDSAWVTSKSATRIEMIVPHTAKEGPVALSTKAAKYGLSNDFTLVKPVVTGYASSEVAAGGEVTFEGENLDLVVAVTFPEEIVVNVTPDNATSFTVSVPSLAVAGDVTLTMVNGDVMECPELTITAPIGAYIPDVPESVIGDVVAIEVANGDKLQTVQINGMTTKYELAANGTTLYIYIPAGMLGDAEFRLISSNGGEVYYTIEIKGLEAVETVVWEGIIDMNENPWGGAGQVSIPNAGFAGAKIGATVRFYCRDIGEGAQIQVNYGDWGGVVSTLTPAVGDEYAEIVLTEEVLAHMLAPAWGSDAFVVQGQGCVVTAISLIQ